MTPPCWLPDLPNSSPQNALLTVRLIGESDFVLSRQRAKQIAALLGFENQDQTRIATAVSEIARNAYEYAGGGRAEFFVDRSPQPQLRIVISDKGKGIDALESIYDGTYTSASGMGLGIMGARRLLDSFDLKTSPQGTVATLIKRIPENKGRIPSDAELVERLPQRHSDSRAAMADQNHELMTLLADLRLRESELTHLNQELEETNRGVLVLYAELEDKSLAVQHASEMKTRFLSGVTHELRTPLNSIVSLSRLLLHRVDGELNAEQEKQVGFILRSAQTLSDMVNDLLDMAKIEAGKTSVKLSDVNVHDTLAGLRGMFRSFITNPGVDLVVVLPEGPDAHSLVVHTDEGKLAQILRNFISNALKYTSEGRVVVKAERVEDNIVFSVADTGIGIAPEHHELVMQEWGQVESAMQNRHKGSGLGLPLSRSLAEVLGGSIHFTSTPGVGSTFYLTLPAQPAERKGSDSNRRAASVHILMADDDEVARYLLRRRLSTLTTAPIYEATTIAECLQAITRSRPAILFLDFVTAGPRGFDVLHRIREQTANQQLPIVLLTARTITPSEYSELESLGIQVISKRLGDTDSNQQDQDEQRQQIERALLQVGLSNMHEGPVNS
ncbi:Signal transduction histidine kinase [Granulicella pectinivorans]|uniref:histidine kinase n=1 Tax=Granulicella pectinivorans TaxID=474950 RepID=A0A1I6LT54_9BACT|nr:Signal transduction histidine kinase [Granulicella pectinivorans]